MRKKKKKLRGRKGEKHFYRLVGDDFSHVPRGAGRFAEIHSLREHCAHRRGPDFRGCAYVLTYWTVQDRVVTSGNGGGRSIKDFLQDERFDDDNNNRFKLD